MIKRVIKWFAQIVWLEANAFYDYRIFKKSYAKKTSERSDQQTLESWILQDMHRVEKAFSLPSPRLGFGKEVIRRLCRNLGFYRERYGKGDAYYIGLGALKAYRAYHLEKQGAEPTFFTDVTAPFLNDFTHPICDQSGYFVKQKRSKDGTFGFKEFCYSRRSCRHYDVDKSSDIGEAELAEIMSMAVTAPSVCNRQHWRVHFFTGDKVKEVLKFQNGNAGFSENVPWLALITSDVRAFYSPDERNQPYVDGGIFAMNLMYAVEAMDMACCPLNWCNSFVKDRSFRKLGYVPDNEVVIAAMAFGYPFETASFAMSPKLSLPLFYTCH